jgi:hypothetical protein
MGDLAPGDYDVLTALAGIRSAATSGKISARLRGQLSPQGVGARIRHLIELGLVSDTNAGAAVPGRPNAIVRPTTPTPSGGARAYRLTPEGHQRLAERASIRPA